MAVADGAQERSEAPEYEIPDELYFSVEYPGNVVNTDRATVTLGGSAAIQHAVEQSETASLEIRFRKGDRFEHPIVASIGRTSDLLIKVKRRGEEVSHEPVGVLRHTARFRSMADWQYNTSASPFVRRLKEATSGHDASILLNFQVGRPENGGFDNDIHAETLDVPPPGVFVPQPVPHRYNYERPANVHKVRGEHGPVLRNRAKPGKQHLYSITGEQPTPTTTHPDLPKVPVITDQGKIDLLARLFAERAAWTRRALHRRTDELGVHYTVGIMKMSLAYVSYMMRSGPWRDTYFRIGYDPRVPSNAHEGAMFQTMYFTNKVSAGKDKGDGEEAGSDDYHFDGISIRPTCRTFQLCDVTDPQIRDFLVQLPLQDRLNDRCGWWPEEGLEVVRTVMKSKLQKLIAGQIPITVDYVTLLDGALAKFGAAPASARGAESQFADDIDLEDDGELAQDIDMDDLDDDEVARDIPMLEDDDEFDDEDDDNDNDNRQDQHGAAVVIDPQLEQEVDDQAAAIADSLRN